MMNNNNEQQTQLSTSKFFSLPSTLPLLPFDHGYNGCGQIAKGF